MDKKEYLEILAEQIRYKKALPMIEKELEDHMEDQKKDFLASGMTEKEAEAAAVMEMGDPVAVGVDMDRIHRPKMAWGLILLTGALYLAGMIFRYLLYDRSGLGIYIANSWVYYVLAFVVMIGVCYVDYSRIGEKARELTVGLFLILMAGIWFGGTVVNGSVGWISVGGMMILNVRVLVYLFLPLYGAILYRYRGQGYEVIWKAAAWMLPAVVVVFYANSLMLALLLCVFSMVIFLLLYAGMVWKFGAVYQKERLQMLLPPYGEEISAVMEPLRSAAANSHMVGSSAQAMKGLEMYGDRDFLFTYILSFCGILTAVLFISLIAVLLFYLLKHTLRQRNQAGRIMGLGCTVVLVGRLVIYLLGNLGLQPYGDGYCPFLSTGGSSAVVTGILLGLLFSIYRYQNIAKEPKKSRTKQICL
jgi:cell division protein FtsW (lipid II flippase)